MYIVLKHEDFISGEHAESKNLLPSAHELPAHMKTI
jgi:hypothetical protein